MWHKDTKFSWPHAEYADYADIIYVLGGSQSCTSTRYRAGFYFSLAALATQPEVNSRARLRRTLCRRDAITLTGQTYFLILGVKDLE